ncbi:MAG TPA: dTDP-4-dehydrorhamnose 3,5-epimerase [Saprospiraceae bacterium]|nr:dTDP-4-dehydrorhamnose 3,5-epimerase [Saprospiraceae bacterium]HMQ83899.1 dTDP-4-dehydrorhamnose 3,5-epimerase [Saprospiraceae bacterium]
MNSIISGVYLTPLKQIHHPQGDLFHALKASENSFNVFGEAYFSTVHQGVIKSWKKHQHMRLNLVVPLGCIRFVVCDDRDGAYLFNEYRLGPNTQYARLTVEPGIWMAFQGLDQGLNLLLNIADMEHDPNEAIRKELEEIPYNWDI